MNHDIGGVVKFVGLSEVHCLSKRECQSIMLLEGLGVSGDAHCGATVKHRSRAAKDPMQPNLRQVHLIHSELHDELEEMGFRVAPGDMGENITTRRVPLLELPVGTRLHLGERAVVEITGLRNPCAQLDQFQPGLMPSPAAGADGAEPAANQRHGWPIQSSMLTRYSKRIIVRRFVASNIIYPE